MLEQLQKNELPLTIFAFTEVVLTQNVPMYQSVQNMVDNLLLPVLAHHHVNFHLTIILFELECQFIIEIVKRILMRRIIINNDAANKKNHS